MQWFDELRGDVSFAVRQLRRSPAFTLVAVTTLALGIGVNSAIFALVDATLLKPLPLPAPDRLVKLWERSATTATGSVSPLNMLDWHERSRTFDVMGGYIPSVGGMVMSGTDGVAETVPRQWVTARIFEALGINAIVGRTFLPTEDFDGSNVVVISEDFWHTRFNADPTVVGRDLRLDGEPYTLVGVVPNAAELLGDSSMWAVRPISRDPRLRAPRFLHVVGRLKPGVSLDEARADLSVIAGALAQEYPATNKGRGVTLAPLHDAMIGSDLRVTSLLFLGVVGFVLLICCANVANLLLARASARTRELAVRSALGAGRRRVVRQLLTESLVLSAIGGLLGVALGAAILRVAPVVIPESLLPGSVTLTFDFRVVAFCAATAVLVGLIFGLAPAWQATRISEAPMIAADSRSAVAGGGRLRRVLVAAEVATAVLLLFGAGLLLRTLLAVEGADRGYRASGVLTMMVDPLGSSYPTRTSLLQFFEAVEEEVGAVPGVRGVAWASTLPMGPSTLGRFLFEIVGDPPVDDSQRPSADYQLVSTTYFETINLAIVAGRSFDERDTGDSTPVCIVNEAFVRRHLAGRSPIGTRVALRESSAQAAPVEREIVGVVRQVKGRPDETEDLLQIYVPLAQNPIDDMFMLVRPSTGHGEALAPSVRAAIGRIDKAQLVSVRDVVTLEDIAAQATARHRFRAVLVMTFAVLALVLALVGVFGILTYSVQQRGREFGLRRALGASAGDVVGLVVRSATIVIVAGAIIGLALSATFGRVLRSMLFGVEPLDVTTFAVVTLVVALTTAAAMAGPAWRATRIDPAVALRDE